MAAFSEYLQYDAVGLGELVRKGDVHPSELVETALEQVERYNPKLNAVIETYADEAIEKANNGLPTSGTLAGVPFLLKDAIQYEGHPFTFASRVMKDYISPSSHLIVKRIEASGLIVIGRTNLSEVGLLPTTESLLYGPAKNPWDMNLSPGGSSGGSAASVAAGIVPMAHGNDGGGSIRIPASACGVFGLKPSRGRTPQDPHDEPTGIVSDNCLTRTVRDSAALLDSISGPVHGDRWWAPPRERPYLEEVERDPKQLRIAFSTTHFDGSPLHPDCLDAVNKTAALCEELGHIVVEARPNIDNEAYSHAFLNLWCTCAGGMLAQVAEELGRNLAGKYALKLFGAHKTVKTLSKLLALVKKEELLEPWTWELADRDAKLSTGDMWIAMNTMREAHYALAKLHENYDLMLSPVLGSPPVPTGTLTPSITFDEVTEKLIPYVEFTPIANTAGVPAMAIPLHWNEAGVPVGSQFIARFGEESTLYQLAGQLERACPWAEKWPPGFGP